MPNLTSGIWRDELGAICIVVQNAHAPTVAEWNGYCLHVAETVNLPGSTAVVLTDGGSPNASQRAQANELLGGQDKPCAVISDSMMVRGVVTAFSWFNKEISVFNPTAIDQAFRFINVGGARVRPLWELICALNARLSPAGNTVGKTERYLTI